MKKLLTLGAALALALSFTSAHAAGPFYAGADFGGLNTDFDNDVLNNAAEDQYLLGNVYFGFQAHENIAVELGYFITTDEDKTADGVTTELGFQGITADVVGNYEFLPKARILGSVGIAYVESDAEVSGGGLTLTGTGDEYGFKIGTGLQYDLTENLAARTTVNYIDGDIGLVTYNAGLQYRF